MAELGDEFIWMDHFGDRNICAILYYYYRPSRYRELAQLTEYLLREAGMNDEMVGVVKRELAKRGLSLAPCHLRVEK